MAHIYLTDILQGGQKQKLSRSYHLGGLHIPAQRPISLVCFRSLPYLASFLGSSQICLIYDDFVGEYSLSTRLWLFILFQWVAFIFMAALGAMVPDTPEDVAIQLQRTAFLSSKVCFFLHRKHRIHNTVVTVHLPS